MTPDSQAILGGATHYGLVFEFNTRDELVNLTEGYLVNICSPTTTVFKYNRQTVRLLIHQELKSFVRQYYDTHWSVSSSNVDPSPYEEAEMANAEKLVKDHIDAYETGAKVHLIRCVDARSVSSVAYWLNKDLNSSPSSNTSSSTTIISSTKSYQISLCVDLISNACEKMSVLAIGSTRPLPNNKSKSSARSPRDQLNSLWHLPSKVQAIHATSTQLRTMDNMDKQTQVDEGISMDVDAHVEQAGNNLHQVPSVQYHLWNLGAEDPENPLDGYNHLSWDHTTNMEFSQVTTPLPDLSDQSDSFADDDDVAMEQDEMANREEFLNESNPMKRRREEGDNSTDENVKKVKKE